MESSPHTRNTGVACPNCGKKLAQVRTCDMELKCKHCGHEFEAVIGPSRQLIARENEASYKPEKEKEK